MVAIDDVVEDAARLWPRISHRALCQVPDSAAAQTDMETYLPVQEILTKCFVEQQFNIKRHIQADGETGRWDFSSLFELIFDTSYIS